MKTIILNTIESLLDKLKAKNGIAYSVIMLALVAIYAVSQYLMSPANSTGIVLPGSIADYLNYALVIIAALTGAHTKSNGGTESK